MNDHWFKPKTFGYGATPSNWKGWAATLGFVAAMLALSFAVFGVTRRSIAWSEWSVWAVGVVVLTAAFFVLARRKTDGEWKWRGFDR